MTRKTASDCNERVLINEYYFKALLSAIGDAKESIDLETYIFSEDQFGLAVTTALIKAVERNVRVRLLVDGVGSHRWSDRITQKLINSGVLVHIYHPIPWKKGRLVDIFKVWRIFASILRLGSRNHRKCCIIDNKSVFISSSNIERWHIVKKDIKIPFRNTSIYITNVAPKDLKQLQYAFDKAWGQIPVKKRWHFYTERIDVDPVFRLNYFTRLRYKLYQSQLERMKRCRKRIWITNAYFLANYLLLYELTQAAKNGIDVRIILPCKYELPPFAFVTETFYSILFNAGVSIYEYSPRILHAKSLILDDWYSVGSSNLNFRSFIHDLEVDAHVTTLEAMATLEKQYLIDIAHSKKITAKHIKDIALYKRIIGHFFLLFKYWL